MFSSLYFIFTGFTKQSRVNMYHFPQSLWVVIGTYKMVLSHDARFLWRSVGCPLPACWPLRSCLSMFPPGLLPISTPPHGRHPPHQRGTDPPWSSMDLVPGPPLSLQSELGNQVAILIRKKHQREETALKWGHGMGHRCPLCVNRAASGVTAVTLQ